MTKTGKPLFATQAAQESPARQSGGVRQRPRKNTKAGKPPRPPVAAGQARAKRRSGGLRPPAAIVPPQAVAGRALTLVVAIMSFLACVTVGSVAIVREAADDWANEITRELTIQIRPADGVDMLREIDKAIALAQEFQGVGTVHALSDAETRELLRPWLGDGLDLDALPVPRLIKVSVDDPQALDLAALRQAVSREIAGGSLDDHSAWTDRLASMANAVVIAGFAILVLVLWSMVLSVVFATRAAMSGNREVVEVLHFVGAEESFIAREFQRHFLLLGLKGGIIGGAIACVIFIGLDVLADRRSALPGVEQATVLFGDLSVGPAGYLGILAVIFLVTVLTAITSRFSVHMHLAQLD
ncbi:cell division protein FtsX [Hongsoonwoonella zoysiae]|uniref:cell division protein FtsX n=1 Tax=Hongsoonwoonella zoysiae TaxID=2821844 RepID=UPI001AED2633|nr:ABC transporter permease [Hongsoonwoonella zoysiae]